MTLSTRLLLQLALTACSSAYVAPRQDSTTTAPTVKVLNGTYSGYYAKEYDTDNFLGIPYAQPPVGGLRYRPAQPLNSTWSGIRNATQYSPECYGYGGDTVNAGNDVSEDCLYINVVRPADQSWENLPVAVWIHGGGYTMGGGSDPRYNLSFIVQKSAEIGSPIIGVSLNYRLSAWGFLYSQELQDSGNANLGLRDQRAALHWVQENIGAFGGNPSQVTMWGQSSGAQAVGTHLLAYGGRDDGLFAGAIGESGTPALIVPYKSAAEWQPLYDNITAGVGCANASDTLQCLRQTPTDLLNSVINSTATSGAGFQKPLQYGVVVDGDFMQKAPGEQLKNGEFVNVPYLLGCNADEGASSGPQGIESTAELTAWVNSQRALDNATLNTLSYLYPDVPAIGRPETLKTRPAVNSTLGSMYKRAAALGGDFNTHAPTRFTSLAWAGNNGTLYKYYFDVLVNGQPYTAGSSHFQEVAFVFFNTEGYGYPQQGLPNPLGGINRPKYLQLANVMTRMWIGFINNGDPNSALVGIDPMPETWPAYTPDAPENYFFSANVTSHTEPDYYRTEGINYFMDLISASNGSNCTSLEDCNAAFNVEYGNTGGLWGL